MNLAYRVHRNKLKYTYICNLQMQIAGVLISGWWFPSMQSTILFLHSISYCLWYVGDRRLSVLGCQWAILSMTTALLALKSDGICQISAIHCTTLHLLFFSLPANSCNVTLHYKMSLHDTLHILRVINLGVLCPLRLKCPIICHFTLCAACWGRNELRFPLLEATLEVWMF